MRTTHGRRTRRTSRGLALALSLTSAGCPRRTTTRHPPSGAAAVTSATAAATDARALVDAAAHAVAANAQPFAREIRGTMQAVAWEGTRCETGDNVVAMFGGTPAFTVTAAERVNGLRAWARAHGRVMVVLETEGADEAPPDCVEAGDEGGIASIEFPPGAWTVARVYLTSRTGITSPFVAGISDAAELPATEPAPLPQPGPREVRVRWRFTTQPPCAESRDECPALALELTGAREQTLTAPTDLGSHACRTDTDPRRPNAIGFGCAAAGFDSVALRTRAPGRYEVATTHESDGNCGGPCPVSRGVLQRFTVPPALRLVPHPAGVFTW